MNVIKINRVKACTIPGFFGSLVFFYVPGAAGGYRVVKWACAGFLLCFLTALLYRSFDRLRLPASTLFLFAATLFPLSHAFSLFADGTDIAISLVGIMRCCIGFAFLLLTGSLCSSFEKQQKETTLFYLLVIAALSTIPLILSFYGMYREGRIFEPGITGTFGNPNWAAGYFVTAIPLALCFLFTAPGNLKKWMAGLSFILLAAGIAVSFSKTAVVTGIVILGVSLLVFYDKKLFRKYFLLVAVPVLLLAIFYYQKSFLQWMEPRLFIWKALVIAMRDNWLVGNGALQALRNFETGATRLIGGDMSLYMPSSQVDFVHNDFLQALAEGGIVGTVSFLALTVLTLAKAYRSESRIVQAAGLSLLALCINGLGDSPLQVPVTFFVWWFFAGVIWCEGSNGEAFVIQNTRTVKAVLVVCLALFLFEGSRQALGSWFWTKSGATTTLVQQKKALKQAVFFIPEAGNVQTEYAQALARSRQYREARAQALRAKAVKFDYDDLYVITEADIALKVIDPVPAWRDIADRFPCLNYPRIKLAEFYLRNKDYQLALDECNVIMSNNCESVNPVQPYAEHAARIIEMIAKAENNKIQSKGDMP